MTESTHDLWASVHFLIREKLYRSAYTAAANGLQQFPRDTVLRLSKGVALLLEGQTAESVRALEALAADVVSGQALGPLIALAAAHKACAVPDHEALSTVEERLADEKKKAGENSFYQAVFAHVLLGQYDAARELGGSLLRISSASSDALAVCGWAELLAASGDKNLAEKYFQQALDHEGGQHTEATLGKATLLHLRRESEAAATLLDRLVIRDSLPALIERTRCQLALYDWEQCLESADRALSADAGCLQALEHKMVVALCRDGDCEGTAAGLQQYMSELERREPRGAKLMLEAAQLFSRCCGRNRTVLAETRHLVEKAAQLRPGIDAACELGRQSFLSGKLAEALRHFRAATRVDNSSSAALTGLSRCQMEEGGASAEQAARQVEFLHEIHPSAEVLFMSSQAAAANGDFKNAIKELDEAVETHFRTVRTMPFGTSYLRAVDPDFLIQVAKQYISLSPPHPPEEGQQPASLRQAVTVLEAATRACPGLTEAQLLLARVQFLSHDLSRAAETLHHILDLDSTSAPAYLLQAQILIQQGDFSQAMQSLEMGLSYNLHVREQPLYHLLMALIQKHQGEVDESLKSLQAGLQLDCSQMSLADQVSLSLELVDTLIVAGDLQLANKQLSAAAESFGATSERGRIVLMKAKLLLAQGDVAAALHELESVSPGQSSYRQAQCQMAEIHLKHRGDRMAYAECFRRLVEHAPGPATFSMLGDAFMQLLDPERALEAYEQALKRSPWDAALACKVGRTLVKAHQYGKAVSYYREAIKAEGSSGQLKLDLAELLARLGQHDRAEKILVQELGAPSASVDAGLEYRVNLLRQLSKIRERARDTAGALTALREARDCQVRLCRRASDNVTLRSEAAALCRKAAELAAALRDHSGAVQLYKEALVHAPSDRTALVAMAKLYMQTSELELCQQACSQLLETDPDNESATVMMADLAFRRVDFDTAAMHFRQLLAQQPTYWTALARLVEVSRRTATLPEAEPFLERATAACQRPDQEAGLCYCRGLFEWYSGNHNAALRFFNGARHDAEWGRQALYNMIEICLDQSDDAGGNGQYEDDSGGNSRLMALTTAERLLAELKPRPSGAGGSEEALSHRLLGNFILLASQQKTNIELALQDLTALASQEIHRDHAGLALGLARAYTQLKQTTRARNQLKRVARSPWRFEEADYLEQCWLTLAEAQGSTSSGASELLARVLRHNRGCVRAHELLGQAAETEQRYRDAAMSYSTAWVLSRRSNPVLGSKLAFCHMKAKRYAEAIDVCQQVLKLQPDFPRIRKDILEKCRNNLRT
ncbi:tetratricopeptide repeat protein 21B-like [Schistocerca gregaria]|uniref:tetratricopeptide repeat protein 21B-like n=1 Tax=Schistocerca gregaria TaxID=7010 RepID=UPI00211E04E8|nr:tetratricopeptide repeat protein 21B-like [Schistocerca gregaria]XP_049834414.1 tetratricopeptide repeat protein 21B-like [Schistocerca gregaria]